MQYPGSLYFLSLSGLLLLLGQHLKGSQRTTKLNFNTKLNDLENDLSVLNESDIS